MIRFFKTFPYAYHLRNLFTRRASSLVNLIAVMVTVLVYVVMNGMSLGLRESLNKTGRDHVLIVLTKGAQSAEMSRMPSDFFPILRYYPEIASRGDGSSMFSEEVYTIKPLKPKDAKNQKWILIRGLDPKNIDVYQDQIQVRGRLPTNPQEVLVGDLVPLKLGRLNIGDEIQLGRQTHKVVGFFSAGGSAYENELWVSRTDLKVDFDLKSDSLAMVFFQNLKDRDAFIARAMADPRLRLEIKTEKEYFASQAENAKFLEWITRIIAVVLSLVSIFTGMNALYASVAARLKEIGTLRAMGYGQFTLEMGLLMEGMILSGVAGFATLLVALPFNDLAIPFLRTSFRIELPAPLLAEGVGIALLVGFLGSLIPARQAARMKIVETLK